MSKRAATLLDGLADLIEDPVLRSAITDVADGLRHEWAAGGEAGAPGQPLERLATTFELSDLDIDLLLLCGLAEEHWAPAHLFTLWNPRGEPWPTLPTVARVLSLDLGRHLDLRIALESGPLPAQGFLTCTETDPLPVRSLRIRPGLWTTLRGARAWPAWIARLDLSALDPVAGDDDENLLGSVVDDLRDRTTSSVQSGAALIVIRGEGQHPMDLAALAAATLSRADVGHVPVDAAHCLENPAEISLHSVARAAVPLVVGSTVTPPLPRHPGPIIVCSDWMQRTPADGRPLHVIEVGRPDLGAMARIWHGLLPELNGTAAQVAGAIRLGRAGAAMVAGDTRASAIRHDKAIDVSGVIDHARRRTNSGLPDAVRLVRPAATFDDLVLTPATTALLRSCVTRVRFQTRVLHDWGFDRALRGGQGVRALLSGPPGTGKSLAAEVLARELELDLLVVDLSALVSKWIGETEKHISAVFDAAAGTQAVLLFDEADAIFGRRTDSGDAQGRWANLETAHLLARVDDFHGLVVLTTNLKTSMDDAFVRRLDVIIELDEPAAAQRVGLWRAHLPSRAPLADDVDLSELGRLYELSGGLIRNAAVAAAYAAAAAGSDITNRILVDAVAGEYLKSGRAFPGPRRPPAIPGGPPPVRNERS